MFVKISNQARVTQTGYKQRKVKSGYAYEKKHQAQ